MAIVTGDRYLDLLARFIEKNTEEILDGSIVLKLNPVGLHYLQTRLEALQELERLRTGAPVDYLRAYIADLGDHRALEQLSRVLYLLPSVKVVSVLRRPARDPIPLTLLPFGRLRSLELRGCDLSTSAARGLLELRPSLEKLICHNSADALRHIFAEHTVEVQVAQVWSRLTWISCAYNGMLLMDKSLRLLPVVQYLDLSRNRFAKVASLDRCLRLKYLDLSFNQLRAILPLNQVKSKISKLVLRNNALICLDGIQNLMALEALDLSHNMISDFNDMELLAALPFLEALWLEGNPIAFATFYRAEVLSFFSPRSKVQLDGRKIARSENWVAKLIASKRHKKRSTYGQYAPAENVAVPSAELPAGVDESPSPTAAETEAVLPTRVKRKMSRLASIEEARSQNLLLPEGFEQEGSPKFQCSFPTPGDTDEKDGSSCHDWGNALKLMHKVENLRKDGSKAWLQELKRLLERVDEQATDTSELSVEEGNALVCPRSHRVRKPRCRRQKDLRRRAEDKAASLFKGYYSEERLESDAENSCEDWRLDSPSSESCEIWRAVSSTDVKQLFDSQLIGSQIKADANHSLPAGKSTVDMQIGEAVSSVKGMIRMGRAGDEGISVDGSRTLPAFSDDSVGSHASSGCPASPPQYHKDLLRKRQHLQEELLRLSVDSGHRPSSSDSETSSDGGCFEATGSSSPADSPTMASTFNRFNVNAQSMLLAQAEERPSHQNAQALSCELAWHRLANPAAAVDASEASTQAEKNASADGAASTGGASCADAHANAPDMDVIMQSRPANGSKCDSKKKRRARKRVIHLD